MSKRIKFHCAECGKEKEDWAYRKPRFCSQQCAFRYASKLPKPWQRRPENFVNVVCEQCNKKYRVHKCQLTKPRPTRFCSRKCQYDFVSQNMRGDKNPNFIDGNPTYYRGPNWGRQARATRKRDNFSCQICGKHGNRDGVKIEVHHIKPYRKFNNDFEKANQLSNLITLCNSCHKKAESGKIPCPKPKN